MPRVLICDPNYSTILALSGALELAGFEILVARDSDDARFKIIMESPDFVLIDWLEFDRQRLKIKDFIEQLKRLRPRTMFIFISHQSVEAQVLSFKDLVTGHGADGYIIKPFNLINVLNKLENWSKKTTR